MGTVGTLCTVCYFVHCTMCLLCLVAVCVVVGLTAVPTLPVPSAFIMLTGGVCQAMSFVSRVVLLCEHTFVMTCS